jgi:hypothetical protein
VFRLLLHVLTLCIGGFVLLVSASAHASIPRAHQGPETALGAPFATEKRIKAKNLTIAECTYRIGVATAGVHKEKVVAISADCGGTSFVWSWPGQNPYRWSDPSGHYAGAIALGVVVWEVATGAAELYAAYSFVEKVFEVGNAKYAPMMTLNSSVQTLAPSLPEGLVPTSNDMAKGGKTNVKDTGIMGELHGAGFGMPGSPDPCSKLQELYDAANACGDSKRAKRIKATAKGLKCRGSSFK